MAWALAAFAVAAIVPACTADHRPPGDSTAVASPAAAGAAESGSPVTPAAVPSTALPVDTCPLEGEWEPCKVERRLTDAGYRPIRDGAAPAGVFPVEGTRYSVGAAELDVYVFQSARDRERAVAALDSVAVAKPGVAMPWKSPPTLIVSNNLAVVLVSDNGRLVERVQDAISAGLPRASR